MPYNAQTTDVTTVTSTTLQFQTTMKKKKPHFTPEIEISSKQTLLGKKELILLYLTFKTAVANVLESICVCGQMDG